MTGWIVPLGGLTVAHGCLMALGGLMFLVTAPIMVMEGEDLAVIVLGVGLGLAWVAVGVVQVGSGIALTRRRGRIPGLIALCAGFVAALPLCGCVPTILVTAIGLVVLTRPEVIAAFEQH